MSKKSGIIYQIDTASFGLALNTEQHESFKAIQKVYLHLYEDIQCTKPLLDPENNKKLVTLKHISKLKPVGFVD